MDINSLTFDVSDLTVFGFDTKEILWVNQQNGLYCLLRFRAEPPDWDFDLRDPALPENFYRNQCASAAGAMLDMKVLHLDGLEALSGLFKYRNPERPLAILYVGIIWIPLTRHIYQINFEATEQGTTGIREAVVMTLEPPDLSEFEFVQPGTADDMMTAMAAKPLRVIASDNEKYDEMFPQHPLSLVRAAMARAADTIRLEGSGPRKPFRI